MDIKEWFYKWQKLLQDYTLPYIRVISQEDFEAQFKFTMIPLFDITGRSQCLKFFETLTRKPFKICL
jgi:hypothetical protein